MALRWNRGHNYGWCIVQTLGRVHTCTKHFFSTNGSIPIVMGDSDSEQGAFLLLVTLQRRQHKRKYQIHAILHRRNLSSEFHNLINKEHLANGWFFTHFRRMNWEQYSTRANYCSRPVRSRSGSGCMCSNFRSETSSPVDMVSTENESVHTLPVE